MENRSTLWRKTCQSMAYKLPTVSPGSVDFAIRTDIHSFVCRAAFPHPKYTPLRYLKHLLTIYSAKEKEGLKRTNWYLDKAFGYVKQQQTYPQTLGYGLADSPAGLLAWIFERLVTWSDNYSWEDDEGNLRFLPAKNFADYKLCSINQS